MRVLPCLLRALLTATLLLGVTQTSAPAQHALPTNVRAAAEWLSADAEFARYPALRSFALALLKDPDLAIQIPDANLTSLLHEMRLQNGPALPYLRLTRIQTRGFLLACAHDRLTMLRAIALIARLIRRANVLLVVDGADLRAELDALQLTDGLSLPSAHVAFYIYIPDQTRQEPFQSHFLVLYQTSFRYTYPRDLITSTVTIGEEEGTQLGARTVLAGTPVWPQLFAVRCELRYDAATAGLFNVHGLGLTGFKSLLGGVAAMFVHNGTLLMESSRLHQQQKVESFESAANAGRYAVHGR